MRSELVARIRDSHRLQHILDDAFEVVEVGRIAAAIPALRAAGSAQDHTKPARLVHRPGQLARRMARVRLRQVHAAELIELYVRDAAREVVGDVPQEPGQKRRAHRALFGGERVGEANRSLRGDRRQVFLRQEAVVERLVETVRRERGASTRRRSSWARPLAAQRGWRSGSLRRRSRSCTARRRRSRPRSPRRPWCSQRTYGGRTALTAPSSGRRTGSRADSGRR